MYKLRGNISLGLFLGMYLLILPILYSHYPAIGQNIIIRILIQLFITTFIIVLNIKEFFQVIHLKDILGGILFGILTFIISNVVSTCLINQFGGFMPDMLSNVKAISLNLSIMSGVILGPICEEIVYRKHLYRRIQTYLINETQATLIVSLIFAISHCTTVLYSGQFQYLHQVLFYIPIGILFQIAYIKSHDIRVPMIAHVLYNTLILF